MAQRVTGLLIEGLAIVSADGMIADANGRQPEGLMLEADQRFFRERLRQAAVVAHGRHSGEGGPEAPPRRRLILTRRVAGVERHPTNGNAALWNPAGAALSQALAAINAPAAGTLAVIGGTDVFGLFLGLGYNLFQLSRAADTHLPGGRPVFPGVPESAPETLLAASGMKADPTCVLDEACRLTLTTWRR